MNLRLALPAVANHAVPMHPKRRRSDSIPPQDGLVIRRILPTRSDYVWDQDQPQADAPAPLPEPAPARRPMEPGATGISRVSIADPAAIPAWKRPFTLPPNVRFTRTPDVALRPKLPADPAESPRETIIAVPAPLAAAPRHTPEVFPHLPDAAFWAAMELFGDGAPPVSASALPAVDAEEPALGPPARRRTARNAAIEALSALPRRRAKAIPAVEEEPEALDHDAFGDIDPDDAGEDDAEDGAIAADEGEPPAPVKVAPRARAIAPAPRPSLPRRKGGWADSFPDYEYPPITLLSEPRKQAGTAISPDALEANARLLEGVLEDFGVRGEIIHVRPGPVVTLYELEPAPGIKSSRVIGLADDIARSMSALSARVAVVPGRNVIGIELPNQKRETVYFRELIGSEDFETSQVQAGALPRQDHRRRAGHRRARQDAASARRRHHRLGQVGRHQHHDPVAALPPQAGGVPPDHGRPEDAGALRL